MQADRQAHAITTLVIANLNALVQVLARRGLERDERLWQQLRSEHAELAHARLRGVTLAVAREAKRRCRWNRVRDRVDVPQAILAALRIVIADQLELVWICGDTHRARRIDKPLLWVDLDCGHAARDAVEPRLGSARQLEHAVEVDLGAHTARVAKLDALVRLPVAHAIRELVPADAQPAPAARTIGIAGEVVAATEQQHEPPRAHRQRV